MGGIYGCGCKEIYRLPHITYPYSSCICSFLQQHPYFLFIFKNVYHSLYIKVGNKVFRQQVGIPMGTNCAPLLANLFLFYYEYEYMKNLVKDNLQAAMKFNGTMRYIDDLLTLNNK